MSEKLAQRNYYGKALAELAGENPNVVVLDADLAGSTKTSDFQKVCPERFVEVGIAEQNMIGIAAGLAASGKVAFASTFGVFATGRCWEQIRLAVAYPRLNVKVVATHCGISVGEDGASHQALEDMAVMRALPNMTVISPADAYEAYSATKAIADYDGPVYMRMGRAEFPTITEEGAPFTIGKATVMREGGDVTLVGCGQMVSFCLDAAEELSKEGIEAEDQAPGHGDARGVRIQDGLLRHRRGAQHHRRSRFRGRGGSLRERRRPAGEGRHPRHLRGVGEAGRAHGEVRAHGRAHRRGGQENDIEEELR